MRQSGGVTVTKFVLIVNVQTLMSTTFLLLST